MTREHAKMLRFIIEQLSKTLDDETALSGVELFPAWKIQHYSVGYRVRYNGKLYKCLTEHTAQETWTPDASPSLWAEVLPGQAGTDIGEWQQPGSTNPYMTGDKVIHTGKAWVSMVDDNVWEPGAYGWEEV